MKFSTALAVSLVAATTFALLHLMTPGPGRAQEAPDPVPVPPQEPDRPLAEVLSQAARAVVQLRARGGLIGCGWIVEEAGLVVTARHVVEGRETVTVALEDGTRLESQVAHAFPIRDLALVRLPERDGGYATLEIAPEDAATGDPVFLVGTAQHRAGVALAGVVATAGDRYEFYSGEATYFVAQLVAAVTLPGSSGGPWVDVQGRAVGITRGRIFEGGTSHTAGLAVSIPISAALPLIRAPGEARPIPTLLFGCDPVWNLGPSHLEEIGAPELGLVIGRIHEDSPLADHGVEEGDYVLAVDGKRLLHEQELLDHIRGQPADQDVRLVIWHRESDTGEEIVVRPVMRD